MRAVFDDIAEQAEKLYKAGVPVEEATERYVVPEKYKTFRQFSWGFCIGRTITEQFYARVVRQTGSCAELFLAVAIWQKRSGRSRPDVAQPLLAVWFLQLLRTAPSQR